MDIKSDMKSGEKVIEYTKLPLENYVHNSQQQA